VATHPPHGGSVSVWQVVRLESGDLLVFGGPSRMIHHGVSGIVPHSRPPWLRMVPGRLNFTFRNTGRGEAY
jgi:alkylated DNA repair protein (DNA oxidative demethylase)